MEEGVLDIPPNMWPKTFGANGVYDITYDIIFMKGGLSQEVYDQVLAHEKAHRAWHHRHNSITKGILKLWGEPPVFFMIAVVINLLSFSTALLDSGSLTAFFAWLAIGLLGIHLFIWDILVEILVWKIQVKSADKELLKQVVFDTVKATPIVLFVISLIPDLRSVLLIFSNVALFVVWLFVIYNFWGALEKLRKAAAKLYNITLKKYSWGNRS